MWLAALLTLVGALQFRGFATGASNAKLIRAEPKETEEKDEAKEEKTDIKAVRKETTEVKEILQSMLVANSQQMFALNKLQAETHQLKEGYAKHHERILECRRKLADLKATTLEALKDEQYSGDVAYPSFIQVDNFESTKESLEESRRKLEKLYRML